MCPCPQTSYWFGLTLGRWRWYLKKETLSYRILSRELIPPNFSLQTWLLYRRGSHCQAWDTVGVCLGLINLLNLCPFSLILTLSVSYFKMLFIIIFSQYLTYQNMALTTSLNSFLSPLHTVNTHPGQAQQKAASIPSTCWYIPNSHSSFLKNGMVTWLIYHLHLVSERHL